jgi:hypothetical protein
VGFRDVGQALLVINLLLNTLHKAVRAQINLALQMPSGCRQVLPFRDELPAVPGGRAEVIAKTPRDPVAKPATWLDE